MPRLSKLIEKAEDQVISRFGGWYERHKEKFSFYIPAGIILWYVYGLFLNSLRLGIDQTFHDPEHEIASIWVWNPFRNLLVVLTPFGIGTTAVIALLTCLIMKKGYNRFSGYKFIRDSRGFDILPEGTHGTSGFLTEKEMREFLKLGEIQNVSGMMLGKRKRHPDDPDKYALYVAHEMRPGDNNNLLCIGAPGSGKTRGFIIPFLIGCAKRKESVFVTDPKGELFEKLSPYFREHDYYVKAVNFLDMEHSDGWNCLCGLDTETQLVQTVANTIIANTSGSNESDDFWSRAELNLLMAMIHYVANLKDEHNELLPIEQRGLGQIYDILATKSVMEINRIFNQLPPDHPARGPHGLFLSCQIVVQSFSQWEEKYPRKEWENQLATFNQTLYMGCNDTATAKYLSEKCGKVTISVTNNQMPLMPLFSPVYTSTRPYSQTQSSTARDLMQPDEFLRLEYQKCIVLFQGHKPAMLYKLTPEELPDYTTLKSCRVIDYIPAWKLREQEEEEKRKAKQQETKARPKQPPVPSPPESAPPTQAQPPSGEPDSEDHFEIVGDAEKGNPGNDLGMQECGADVVVGEDDPDLPPR